jgi:integrin alpha FG-GAP repeat containing protein 1
MKVGISIVILFTSILLFHGSMAIEGEGPGPVSINEFNSKIFWEKDHQGMVELDLFFSNVTDSMLIVAVGDMDGDKYSDIITVNQDRSAFRVFLYNSKSKRFVFGEREFPTECIIANVQTIKTTSDKGGILVTCSKPQSIMKVYVYDDDIHDFTEDTKRRTKIKKGNQPFITDFNGDFFPDILYQDDDGIKIAFHSGAEDNMIVERFDNFVRQESGENKKCMEVNPNRQLASPGSVAYADIDGDCIADLLLTTTDSGSGQVYLEVYVSILGHYDATESDYNFNTRYCLVKRAPLPEDIDPILIFSDFDREGMIDVLGFSPKRKSIYMFKNGLKPRSASSDGL